MESYFQKIDSIINVLTSLDSRVNDEDLVHYALDGLPDKCDKVCGYMHHKDVFPDLKIARSMLITEDMRLKSKSLSLSMDSSSSSPIVLMADSGNSRHSYTPQATTQVKSWRPCFNFAKGTCRFGDCTEDLYPVTAPSPIPHVFLVSQHTWHQRLGYPRSEVLRHLVSHNFIYCNKEKPPVLCHACQLGKHVRLSFASSSTLVTSCFDIIHSDVWT
nr:ribonuclease H-like domain-containing protein [Tanacetum cinerariifolium]